MATIDTAHTFTLEINSVDRWSLVDASSLRMRDNEGSEIDTLVFDIDDADVAITITPWQVVEWVATDTVPDTYLFGGYVTSITSNDNPSGLGRILTVACEGYMTRCHKVESVTKTYVDTTPGAIAADLFTQAGITDFDTSTYVTAGSALSVFVVQNETLAKSMDRLAEVNGWVWRVDPQKNVYLGLASSDQSDYDVSDEANADYVTVFPVEPGVTLKTTADEIKNKVVVHGGYTVSSIQTDEFNGDGSTQMFNLTYNNITRIHEITVDGTQLFFGQDGWHGNSLLDIFDSGVEVLVNYRAGYVYFETPPGIGTNNVDISYTYNVKLTWEDEDAASIALYGLTFVYNYYDNSITSDNEAQDVISAILTDFANAVEQGTFSVRRLGLAAGQEVNCNFPALSVSDDYTIRSVTTTMAPAIGRLVHTVTYGGRSTSLSKAIEAATNRAQAYDDTSMTGTNINDAHVYTSLEVGVGTFTPPT